jgi:hypothetical protein
MEALAREYPPAEPPAVLGIQTILVAWTEARQEWDGRAVATDLGQRPTFRTHLHVYCCVWLLDGDARDIRAAEAFASQQENGRAFAYINEADPLSRAHADMQRELKHK